MSFTALPRYHDIHWSLSGCDLCPQAAWCLYDSVPLCLDCASELFNRQLVLAGDPDAVFADRIGEWVPGGREEVMPP